MNCKYCDREVSNKGGLVKHQNSCKLNPNRKIYKSNFIQYHKDIKNGLKDKTYQNQFTKAKLLGKEIPKMSNETKKKIGLALSKHAWSDSQRLNHSKIMSEVARINPKSYSSENVSGRVKSIDYNGFKLKGSWELLVAEWLDFNNIKWTNIIEKEFLYEWNGSPSRYYPDFYLFEHDLYIEVKGYQRKRDLLKWKVVPNLMIIKKKEIDLIKKGQFYLSNMDITKG